jgi:hypothetical protein
MSTLTEVTLKFYVQQLQHPSPYYSTLLPTALFFPPMARQPLGGLGRLIFGGFTITLFRHITLGRTPLDEGPARRRDLYLTEHNTHKRQTSMPPVGFEPTILVSERPQTHALDRTATRMGHQHFTRGKKKKKKKKIYIYIYIYITKTLQIFTLPMHTKTMIIIITMLTDLSHQILLAANIFHISFPATAIPEVYELH